MPPAGGISLALSMGGTRGDLWWEDRGWAFLQLSPSVSDFLFDYSFLPAPLHAWDSVWGS
jgi:hypothetical protein